ncbi:MAG: hypothetical protein U0T74_11290 [Chitinophagales bacterium]
MLFRLLLIPVFVLMFSGSAVAQETPKDSIPYKIGKYDIKKQEKVFVVAQKLKVDPNIIVRLNKLRNIKQDLVQGQRIKIPVYPKGYVYQPEKVVIHRSVDQDSAKMAKLDAMNPETKTAQSPLKFFDADEDKMRLMMVDAMLELNEAMMQGIQASFDSLNIEDNAGLDEKNIQAMLRKMKRSREKVLLTPYLEHVRDSLTNEITTLKTEKQAIEFRLNPAAAPIVKTDTIVAEMDTIVYQTKTFADNRPAEKTVTAVMINDEIVKDDKTKIEVKRNDERKKKLKDYYALDTVIVYDLPSSRLEPAPEIHTNKNKLPITGVWDTARAIDPLVPKSLWDTARAVNPLVDTNQKQASVKTVDVRKDSTIALKIKVPGMSDSIVIKPILKQLPEVKIEKDTMADIKPQLTIQETDSALVKIDSAPKTTIFVQDADTITKAYVEGNSDIIAPLPTSQIIPVSDTIHLTDTLSTTEATQVKKEILQPAALSNSDSIRKIKAEFFFKRSQKAMAEKNFRNAEQYLHKSIELFPNYFDAWFALAEMDALFGSQQTALKEYKTCSEIDSTRPKLYINLGNLYAKMKRKTDAYNAYNKVLELSSDNIPALISRASILTDWKKYNEAIADYDRVIQVNRAYHYAYKARGQVKLLTREFATAIDDFTRFLIFEETDPSAYYYRGLAKLGNNELLDGCLDLSTAAEMGYTAAEKAIKRSCE